MSIVCATHFTGAAEPAAHVAAALAARRGVPLHLVHVLPEATRAYAASVRAAAERALVGEVDRLSARGAEVQGALLEGRLDEVLEGFAHARGAELLVVGAPRRTPAALGLGGSLDRLVQSTSLPLLVVRPEAEAGLVAWARGERPLRVVVGLDRSEPSEAALAWAAALQRVGPVAPVAARVFWSREEYDRLGVQAPHAFGEVTPELQQALERDLAAQASALGSGVRVRVRPSLGRLADVLVDLSREEQADLLVVGTHHRSGLGRLWSVSHHALRLAPMAVACVPSRAPAAEAAPPLPARRVLVGVDFSEASDRAVRHAFGVVRPGGSVHLVHVAEGRPAAAQEAELRAQLRARVAAGVEQDGTRAELEVLADGDVAQALVQAAERHDADLVCLGTQGRGAVTRALLGSVAERVLDRCPRPVLLVRRPRG